RAAGRLRAAARRRDVRRRHVLRAAGCGGSGVGHRGSGHPRPQRAPRIRMRDVGAEGGGRAGGGGRGLEHPRMKVLVIDIGGTNLKVSRGAATPIKIPSGPRMTAGRMADAVLKAIDDWKYDVVAIGYPGPVAHGRPARDPKN